MYKSLHLYWIKTEHGSLMKRRQQMTGSWCSLPRLSSIVR